MEKVVVDKFYIVSILKVLFETHYEDKGNGLVKPLKDVLIKLGKSYHSELKKQSVKDLFITRYGKDIGDKYDIMLSKSELRQFLNAVNRLKGISIPKSLTNDPYKEYQHIITVIK